MSCGARRARRTKRRAFHLCRSHWTSCPGPAINTMEKAIWTLRLRQELRTVAPGVCQQPRVSDCSAHPPCTHRGRPRARPPAEMKVSSGSRSVSGTLKILAVRAEPCIWAAPMAYRVQVDLLNLLHRIIMHYCGATFSSQTTPAVEGSRMVVSGCILTSRRRLPQSRARSSITYSRGIEGKYSFVSLSSLSRPLSTK